MKHLFKSQPVRQIEWFEFGQILRIRSERHIQPLKVSENEAFQLLMVLCYLSVIKYV